MRQKIGVIGGGIIGMSVAWSAQRSGHEVMIFESQKNHAMSSSCAAAGMLAAQLEQEPSEEILAPILYKSQKLWHDFHKKLQHDSNISLDYMQNGTMLVATDQDTFAKLQHYNGYLQKLGQTPIYLNPRQARNKEPLLSPRVTGALFCPDDHHVDPRMVICALETVLHNRIAYNHEITTLQRSAKNNQLTITTQNNESYTFDKVIIANGAWANQHHFIDDIPRIDPVKGQAIYVQMPEYTPPISHVLWGDDVYLVPRNNKRIYIGATVEHLGFDNRTTVQAIYHLLKQARLVLPNILEATITETIIGYRPRPMNDMPVVRESDTKNVFLCLGHYRNGILLAPWTCQVMGELLNW